MSTLAERQLAAWQAIARDWPMTHGERTAVCVRCGKGIALTCDSQGRLYQYTPDQWGGLVVLHLRNHHADLDPDREAT